MNATSCPDRNRIAAYALGTLSEAKAAELAAHLETCMHCDSTVQSLDNIADPVVDSLRQSPAEDPYVVEPEYRRALAELRVLRATSSSSGPGSTDTLTHTLTGQPTQLRQLGQYRLLAKLGAGGMGTVYKALHTKLDRVVSVKVLPAESMQDKSAVVRFEREMKAVGNLKHPNIVQAHDAGEANETHFLVMEYVEGMNLAELVRRHGQLAVADACELVRQAALGLQYAHEHGLVHRDVKPSNVMLASSGEVKVLDFGLALLRGLHAEGAGELTDAGQVMGTVDYMAPEQGSDSHQVDIRADIYSLGATLYKLLSGSAPFAADKYDTPLKKRLALATETVPSVASRRKEVPERLARVLGRMLARSPEGRFSTPADVAHALEPFVTGCDLEGLFTRSQQLAERPTSAEASLDTSDEQVAAALAVAQSDRASRRQRGVAASRRRWNPMRVAVGLLLACLTVWVAAQVIIRLRQRGGGDTEIRVSDAVKIDIETNGKAEVKVHGSPKVPASSPGRPLRATAPFDEEQAREHQQRWAEYLKVPVEQTNAIGMNLVLIPPGEFRMGTSEEQLGQVIAQAERDSPGKWDTWYEGQIPRESPQHPVKITRPFYLGRFEVTVGQFRAFVEATQYKTDAEKDGKGGYSPSGVVPEQRPEYNWSNAGFPQTDEHPVINVSWNDAVAFCQWLSESSGQTYRLPTEAEWEYACRAGTTTSFSFGDDLAKVDDYAWHDENCDSGPQPVGKKKPNAWGLRDMHGNLWEWCADWYGDYDESLAVDPTGSASDSEYIHAVRGGSWLDETPKCRSAMRLANSPTNCFFRGFRVVCER
ncbi:MAG: SUMF1/EgtB/PvdO family nonheme iron enzyme [Planctomycetota bacterium]